MLEEATGFYRTSLQEKDVAPASAIEMELHSYNISNNNEANWQDIGKSFDGEDHQYLLQHPQNSADLSHPPYCGTHDFLDMFPPPSINFSNSAQNSSSGLLASLGLFEELVPPPLDSCYDPLLGGLDQAPFLREFFHGGASFNSEVFEFKSGEMDHSDGRNTKHLGPEKQRRELIKDNFEALRKLIPNPTKNDRASIMGDAINYINELKKTASELKALLQKKRSEKERVKRANCENISLETDPNSCSWLQRKSYNTEVDVRIIMDQVTVKLVHHKRIKCCLVLVSKIFDEFQLDLHDVAGGVIGDHYSFLFNSKICEGAIVKASSLANKLIEVMEEQCAVVCSSINQKSLLLPLLSCNPIDGNN